MKVFVVFLLAVFCTATLSPSERQPRAVPLLIVCVLVAAALSSFRLAS